MMCSITMVAFRFRSSRIAFRLLALLSSAEVVEFVWMTFPFFVPCCLQFQGCFGRLLRLFSFGERFNPFCGGVERDKLAARRSQFTFPARPKADVVVSFSASTKDKGKKAVRGKNINENSQVKVFLSRGIMKACCDAAVPLVLHFPSSSPSPPKKPVVAIYYTRCQKGAFFLFFLHTFFAFLSN